MTATTDEEMAAHTVGELRPLNSSICLMEYDPNWPTISARQAQRIRAALGTAVVRLEHVGSTAVPSLAAKPLIDILLVVADSADESSYVPPIEGVGYVLKIREPNGTSTGCSRARILT